MLKNIAPKPRKATTAHARRLRRKMILPEVIIWHWLRQRPDGLKFRRQHPTGGYILDFYCGDARLAIEIDGQGHSFGDRPVRDAARDTWLQKAGIRTLRIAASEVLNDADSVISWIVSEARQRLPLHHPAFAGWSPSPRQARGGFAVTNRESFVASWLRASPI